jgi:predicted metallo-beta-lactamase superfamily hydrolase
MSLWCAVAFILRRNDVAGVAQDGVGFRSVPEIARLVDVELVIVPFVAVNPTKFAS